MARRFLAAVVLVLLGAAPSLAGEPTDRLRTFFERANRIILAPELEGGVEERVTAVRALVNGIFDFDGASALALGRHWEPLPPPARAAFTRLYADVIERAYLAWVGGKARVGEGGVTIRWLGEAVEHDAATVSSLLLTRTGGAGGPRRDATPRDPRGTADDRADAAGAAPRVLGAGGRVPHHRRGHAAGAAAAPPRGDDGIGRRPPGPAGARARRAVRRARGGRVDRAGAPRARPRRLPRRLARITTPRVSAIIEPR